MTFAAPLIISLLASSLATGDVVAGGRIELASHAEGELILVSLVRDVPVGTFLEGEPAHHVFEFRVEGGPLRIVKVRPSVSCTVGPLEVRVPGDASLEHRTVRYTLGGAIQEGATVLVDVYLSTSNAHGSKRVSARVDWAPLLAPEASDVSGHLDAARERLGVRTEIVRLSGDVRPFFLVDPPFHALGDIPMGESRTVTSLIRTSTGKPFQLAMLPERVAAARSEPDPVASSLRPLHPRPDGCSTHWQATFHVPDSAPPGSGGLVLRARHAPAALGENVGVDATTVERTLGITLSYRVVGPFRLEEEFVSFGLFRPDEEVDRILELHVPEEGFDAGSLRIRIEPDSAEPQSESQSELQSERAAAALKTVTCRVLPRVKDEGPVRLRLRVGGVPIELEGTLRGRLVVETGDQSQPELVVRFAGVCRSGARKGTENP